MKKCQLNVGTFFLSVSLLFFVSGCGGGGSSTPANAATGVTAAQVAGTWKSAYFYSYNDPTNGLCFGSNTGTTVAGANGSISVSNPAATDTCTKSGVISNLTNAAYSGTGTFTVNTDGSGTVTYSSGTIVSFQISTDLNTLILFSNGSAGAQSGTAVRM